MRRLLDSFIGDRSELRFSSLYSIRFSTGQGRSATLFTITAVATCVALATGLELSTRSVATTARRTADALTGPAEIEVTGGELGVPEAVLGTVRSVPGVRAASPTIHETFRILGGSQSGHALKVIGLDFLEDVRPYRVSQGGLVVHDVLRLVAAPGSVIVTRRLADRLGLSEGDPLRVSSVRGEFDLTIRGLLEPGGLADAYDGQIAAMDVYSLQTLLGRDGREGGPPTLDQIDVVPAIGADVDALVQEIQKAVQGTATVRPAALRDLFVDRVLGSVRLAVYFFGAVGVLVAGFLSYATMSLSVDRRRGELALLRAAGLEARRVGRLIYVDALSVSIVGSAIGLVAGWLISDAFTSLFSRISSHLQNAAVAPIAIAPSTFAVAACVGLVVSLMGAVAPARTANRLSPLEALRAESGLRRERHTHSVDLAAGLLLAFWLVFAVFPVPAPALSRLAVLIVGGLVLVVVAFRFYMGPVFRGASRLFERSIPRIGTLVGSSLLSRPMQSGLTVASLAGVVAALTGILVVISSMNSSIRSWIEGRYSDGIVISVGDPFEALDGELLTHETIQVVRDTPDAIAILEQYDTNTLFRGEQVAIRAMSMDVLAEHGRLPVIDGDPKAQALELVEGRVAVSTAFARRFNVSPGDEISLTTPAGERTFEVSTRVRHFGGPTGVIYIDIGAFDEHWRRPGADYAVVWTDRSTDQTRSAITEMLEDSQMLFFTSADEFADYSKRVMDRYMAMLYLIAGLTAVLAGVAIASLLLGTIAARRRELALMRVAGGTSAIIGALVLLDGLIVALVAGSLGVLLGLKSASPMCDVLQETLGWTLAIEVSWLQLTVVVIGIVAISLVGSMYPVLAAQRVQALEILASE